MKRAIIIFVLIILSFLIQEVFAEKELSDYLEDNINSLNTTDLDEYINKLLNEDVSIKDYLIDITSENKVFSFDDFISNLLICIKNSFVKFLSPMLIIIFISMLNTIISSFNSNFLKEETNNLTYFVCYASITMILIALIFDEIEDITALSNKMAKFMELSFPIVLTLITSLGGVNSQLIYKPYMSVLTTSISSCITNIVIPCISTHIIVMIISNMSNKIKLDKLSLFFKSFAKIVLCGVFSLFITLLTFQGLTSGVIDTLTIKTAKSAIENYIPILGEYLSEGYDLVLASIVLIKNSFGYISITILLSIIIYPVVKIIILSFMLKITAAVVEPLSNNKISDFIYKISTALNMFIGVIVGMFAMFSITIMLCIISFNVGV